jgi:hypothetical protein
MTSILHRSGRRWSALAMAALLTVASSSTALAAGKPGYPDRITWSGETWQIKTSRSAVGPGPNVFDKANVSLVGDKLRLQIQKNDAGTWTSAEIIGPRTYGYGTYTFVLDSPVHALDPNVVLGLFTWSDRARFAHREIDIEFAKWGSATDGTNAQYVVQPHGTADHLYRFVQPDVTTSKHQFTWRAGRIVWESFRADGTRYATYTYEGADVPPSGDERVRLNLWLFQGAAPTNGAPVEVVISSFTFTP